MPPRPPKSAPGEDHRVRVAAERKERTRLKLLETALAVIYDKGTDAVVIDDFITAAGVSRGTFYNHFKTLPDLLLALASAMSDEFVAAVNDYILTCKSPLERLSAGVRLYMSMALRYPIWGTFLSRVGVRIAVRGQPIEGYITRDLTDAKNEGLIFSDDILVARDMVVGSIFYGIGTMVSEPSHSQHPQILVEAILRGLRAPEALIPSLAHGALPNITSIESPLFSKIKPDNLETYKP